MSSPARRSRRRPSPRSSRFPYAASFFLIALGLWSVTLVRHWQPAAPGAWAAWVRGAALLAGAAGAYASLARGLWAKKRSLLGLFPLAWLALSRCQWELAVRQPAGVWAAVLLFLALAAWIGYRREGKQLLLGSALLWTLLDALWPQALFLPLAFLTARRGLVKEARWVRWGGAAAFLVLFTATRAWQRLHWDGLDVYDRLFGKHFTVFGVFVLLGWAAFPAKGTQRLAPWTAVFLVLGLWVVAPSAGRMPGWEGLEWIWIWAAGFGFESLRRDLLDESWHGRAVWTAAGMAAFAGLS